MSDDLKMGIYIHESEANKLHQELTKTVCNLRWLVDHAIDTGIISKAKGAELMGIPLIDFNYETK